MRQSPEYLFYWYTHTPELRMFLTIRTASMVNTMKNCLLLLLAASLLLLLTGCGTTRDMAKVRSSAEAEQLFFNEGVASQYNYYYYGTGEKPIALLALDKNYILQSQFWHETKMTDAMRQNWADLFTDNVFRSGTEYRGKEIVSPQSVTIGYVLSSYHWVTAWFDTPNSPVITIPPPEKTPQQPDLNKLDRDRP